MSLRSSHENTFFFNLASTDWPDNALQTSTAASAARVTSRQSSMFPQPVKSDQTATIPVNQGKIRPSVTLYSMDHHYRTWVEEFSANRWNIASLWLFVLSICPINVSKRVKSAKDVPFRGFHQKFFTPLPLAPILAKAPAIMKMLLRTTNVALWVVWQHRNTNPRWRPRPGCIFYKC